MKVLEILAEKPNADHRCDGGAYAGPCRRRGPQLRAVGLVRIQRERWDGQLQVQDEPIVVGACGSHLNQFKVKLQGQQRELLAEVNRIRIVALGHRLVDVGLLGTREATWPHFGTEPDVGYVDLGTDSPQVKISVDLFQKLVERVAS